MNKAHVSISLVELFKILTQKEKVKNFCGFDKVNEAPAKDAPIVLQTMNQGKKNGGHSPLYVSILVNDLLLHNYILDMGEPTNLMSLNVMRQLGITITMPYRNVCAMDSMEINVFGLIKELHVKSVVYPNISILMY